MNNKRVRQSNLFPMKKATKDSHSEYQSFNLCDMRKRRIECLRVTRAGILASLAVVLSGRRGRVGSTA